MGQVDGSYFEGSMSGVKRRLCFLFVSESCTLMRGDRITGGARAGPVDCPFHVIWRQPLFPTVYRVNAMTLPRPGIFTNNLTVKYCGVPKKRLLRPQFPPTINSIVPPLPDLQPLTLFLSGSLLDSLAHQREWRGAPFLRPSTRTSGTHPGVQD